MSTSSNFACQGQIMGYPEVSQFVYDNEQQIVFHHIPAGPQFLQSPGISNQPFEEPYYLADINDYQSASLSPQHSYSLTTFLVDAETTTAATVATYPLASSQMTDMQVTRASSDNPSGSSLAFRPSEYELVSVFEARGAQEAPQTATFKNSHYNTAHYNNPNFQPEEWTPEFEGPPKSTKEKHQKSEGQKAADEVEMISAGVEENSWQGRLRTRGDNGEACQGQSN